MTTLESRYDERVRELARARGDGTVSEAEAEYILDTMPFIREYAGGTSCGGEDRRASSSIDSFFTVTGKSNRSLIYQQYLAEVEGCVEAAQTLPTRAMRDREDAMTCPACDRSMLFNARDAELVCVGCGSTRVHMDMSAQNITYDQESQQNSIINYFAYKRLNHFTEWLNSLQARENTEIPTEVLEAVRAEFRKERASKRGDIKPSKVRAYLKKLKLNKVSRHDHQHRPDDRQRRPRPRHVLPKCSGTRTPTPSATRSTACRPPNCRRTWRSASSACLARSRSPLSGTARLLARTFCHTRRCRGCQHPVVVILLPAF